MADATAEAEEEAEAEADAAETSSVPAMCAETLSLAARLWEEASPLAAEAPVAAARSPLRPRSPRNGGRDFW